MTQQVYDVFALRYAQTAGRTAHENFLRRDMHDGPMPLDFFVWIIEGNGRRVIVDTGFGERAARERGRTLTIHPVEALRRIGIAPESVEDVVLTHLHFDHAGNLGAFSKARIHVQDAEVAYATGRCMCHGVMRFPYDLEDVLEVVRRVYAERVVFHDGDGEIADGIDLCLLPGHTRGLQGVRVRTARGPVLLASDAAHFYANLTTGNPFPLITDVGVALESHRRMLRLVPSPDHVVPGHDPLVRSRYPAIARNGIELVCLHEPPRRTEA